MRFKAHRKRTEGMEKSMAAYRVHKSLRIDGTTADRVAALREAGESEARTYNRVLVAGLDVLEAEDAAEIDAGADTADTDADRDNAYIKSLTATLDALVAQLEAKDEQIRTLGAIANQAQALNEKALASSRQGFFKRLFG